MEKLQGYVKDELISIGITCYNSEKTIIDCLNSAVNQVWLNKEIIIINDRSTDKTDLLIKKFIDRNKKQKIKYIVHKKNKRYAGALNSLICNAKGKYLCIFDSDDISDNERLKLQYNRLIEYEKQKEINQVLCYGPKYH